MQLLNVFLILRSMMGVEGNNDIINRCSDFTNNRLFLPNPSSVTIDSLYKVTEGGQSDIFHRHADGSFDPACCFTVYHGNHMESLDLVTSNAEEARTWITGLRYLMAGISDEDSLAKRQRTHDQYPLNLNLPL